MADNIGKMGGSGKHQFFSHRKRDQAGVLTDNKYVEGITLGSGCFHKVLVAKGKRVGVHDQRARQSAPFGLGQVNQIAGKTVFSVLHKRKGAINPCDFIKA